MKQYCLFIVGLFLTMYAKAQDDPVFMRVCQTEVRLSEFEYAFNKHCSVEQKVPVKDFLVDFINHKVLVEAAREQKVDTSFQYRNSLMELGLESNSCSSYVDGQGQGRFELFSVYIPQNAGYRTQQEAMHKIDSVWVALKSGSSTEQIIRMFPVDGRIPLRLTAGIKKRNQTYKEVEQVMFTLQNQEISKPFLTPEGYCVVRVIDSPLQSMTVRQPGKNVSQNRYLQDEYREGILVRSYLERLYKKWGADNVNNLYQFYNSNLKTYSSTIPSFEGIVLACKSSKQLKAVKKELKRMLPSKWMAWIQKKNESLIGDKKIEARQGVFEMGDCSVVDCLVFKQNEVEEDWAAYPYQDKLGRKMKKRQMPFTEAHDQVKADYIQKQEDCLLSELRRKYQVMVDESVLRRKYKL